MIAVEPDELNQEILREKFLKYRLNPKPVVIVGKAVSERIATETMWIDGPGSALNTLSQKWVEALKEDSTRFEQIHSSFDFARRKMVETTTLEKLITAHGLPFFVKIDVEGHELSVLHGMQRPVPCLSFEINLRGFRHEGIECIQMLIRLEPCGRFNCTPDWCSGLVLKRWLGSEEFCAVLIHVLMKASRFSLGSTAAQSAFQSALEKESLTRRL